jgi:hypothetical protein
MNDRSIEDSDTNHWEDMRNLLTKYHDQFIETKDLIESKNETVHPDLVEAIKVIEKQINAHWVRR